MKLWKWLPLLGIVVLLNNGGHKYFAEANGIINYVKGDVEYVVLYQYDQYEKKLHPIVDYKKEDIWGFYFTNDKQM